jgi:type VI secretion system secreted protein VgrG
MASVIDTPAGRFEYALNILLLDEGGYSNDEDDPGGATNLGITQEDLDSWNKVYVLSKFPKDVQHLTRDNAEVFYKILWWDKYKYDAIKAIEVASKLFNIAVNTGAKEAHKIAQKALQYCGYSSMAVDGVLGPKTIAAINECCLHGREEDLMAEIRIEQVAYYETITEENPKLYKFLKGWIRRAEE